MMIKSLNKFIFFCILLFTFQNHHHHSYTLGESVFNIQRKGSLADDPIQFRREQEQLVGKQHQKQQDNYQHHQNYDVHEENSVQWCGKDTDIFHLKSVELIPDPPIINKKLRIKVEGFLDEDIVEGSYALVEVKFGLIRFLNQTFDICQELKQINETCPLKKGDFNFDKDFDVPFGTPAGRYSAHATAVNADGLPIGCAIARFRLAY